MNNFLGMNRGLLDHWVYSDLYTWRVWSHILFMAQYSTTPNQWFHNGYWITQEYGEFVYGRDAWSLRLQVPEQRLRTIMKKFEKEGMITPTGKNTPKCSVYAVTNYAKFNQQSNQQEDLQPQPFEDDANQQDNQRLTSSQPAANHNKDSKEDKKDKKEITSAKYFENQDLNDAFLSYIDMRKKIKAPMTNHAIDLAISKLKTLAKNDDYLKIAIINESIMNSYKGLFAYNGVVERPKKVEKEPEPELPVEGSFYFSLDKVMAEKEGGIDAIGKPKHKDRKNNPAGNNGQIGISVCSEEAHSGK